MEDGSRIILYRVYFLRLDREVPETRGVGKRRMWARCPMFDWALSTQTSDTSPRASEQPTPLCVIAVTWLSGFPWQWSSLKIRDRDSIPEWIRNYSPNRLLPFTQVLDVNSLIPSQVQTKSTTASATSLLENEFKGQQEKWHCSRAL